MKTYAKANNYNNFFIYLIFYFGITLISLISLFLPNYLKKTLAVAIPFDLNTWYDIFTAIFITKNILVWLIDIVLLGLIVIILVYLNINAKLMLTLFFFSAAFCNILLVVFYTEQVLLFGPSAGVMALTSCGSILLFKKLRLNKNPHQKLILQVMLLICGFILLEGIFISHPATLFEHLSGMILGLIYVYNYLKNIRLKTT